MGKLTPLGNLHKEVPGMDMESALADIAEKLDGYGDDLRAAAHCYD